MEEEWGDEEGGGPLGLSFNGRNATAESVTLPVCRPDCGPGSCVAPNMCRCSDGVEAPNCGGGGGGYYPYPVRTRGGCPRICMNGGTCTNGTCSCAPGWSGEFCTEPICREPCLHGGRCIAPDRCVCFQGLSGTRCEIDRRTGPCYTDHRGALCTNALEGVVCTKQMCCATVGIGWGHPCERCSELDCPIGHLRNLLTKECQDIDECAAVPGLCGGGRCVNSIGSFSCECPPGQRRHNVSNNCEDINECEDPDICPNGKCVNTEGDYYCLCNPHFIPSPDKKYCIDSRISDCYTELTETGQCLQRLNKPLSNRDCCCGRNMGRAWGDYCAPCPPISSAEWIHLCGGTIPPSWPKQGNGNGNGHGNVYGNGTVSSTDGRLHPPGPIAKIDECTLRPGICGLGDCVDLEVGYRCNCWEGAESTQPDGNPTCIDIDECALGWCEGGTCRNRDGGFDCRCPPGFDPVDNARRCSDKDECSDTNGGMCSNGYCINIDGSFRCNCNPGYELTETGHACQDVDECRDNPRVCRRGRCWNTPGSYECRCEPGFESVAGYCADIDECAEKTLCQGGRCVNSEGSFQCVCEAGYRPTPDRGACADVDECTEQRVCRNGRCHNSPGSFRCECMSGFTLSSDGRTCIDEIQDLCYENFEDEQCRGPGSVAVTRSQCCCSASKGQKLAWGVSCKPCPKENTTDFDILCREGSGKDNAGTDINECTMIPGGQCRNTQGSFMCVCPSGTRYEPDDQLCRDIDECEGELPPVGYDYNDPRGDIPPLLFPGYRDEEINCLLPANPLPRSRHRTHHLYEERLQNGGVRV
ncbi:Fibrillin-1 [Eumeta japonica]|uniref:Fibrillin-1 n=1 Tax=Eumeta variegata TaxID=151549 RepID=A0A4C1U715_EUMVA|nr:Fibrillin-1 [Eumeta japonica]